MLQWKEKQPNQQRKSAYCQQHVFVHHMHNHINDWWIPALEHGVLLYGEENLVAILIPYKY